MIEQTMAHLSDQLETAEPQHRQAIADRIAQLESWISRGLTEDDEGVQEACEEWLTHF